MQARACAFSMSTFLRSVSRRRLLVVPGRNFCSGHCVVSLAPLLETWALFRCHYIFSQPLLDHGCVFHQPSIQDWWFWSYLSKGRHRHCALPASPGLYFACRSVVALQISCCSGKAHRVAAPGVAAHIQLLQSTPEFCVKLNGGVVPH